MKKNLFPKNRARKLLFARCFTSVFMLTNRSASLEVQKSRVDKLNQDEGILVVISDLVIKIVS